MEETKFNGDKCNKSTNSTAHELFGKYRERIKYNSFLTNPFNLTSVHFKPSITPYSPPILIWLNPSQIPHYCYLILSSQLSSSTPMSDLPLPYIRFHTVRMSNSLLYTRSSLAISGYF